MAPTPGVDSLDETAGEDLSHSHCSCSNACDDRESDARASERPPELLLFRCLLLARVVSQMNDSPIRQDDLSLDNVVHCEAVLATEEAEAAR